MKLHSISEDKYAELPDDDQFGRIMRAAVLQIDSYGRLTVYSDGMGSSQFYYIESGADVPIVSHALRNICKTARKGFCLAAARTLYETDPYGDFAKYLLWGINGLKVKHDRYDGKKPQHTDYQSFMGMNQAEINTYKLYIADHFKIQEDEIFNTGVKVLEASLGRPLDESPAFVGQHLSEYAYQHGRAIRA